jgi:uncharacterized membrane protein
MNLNWKLIIQLSAFGLAMAVATVWWIPGRIEGIFWLGIFVYCAYTVAKQAPGNYFLHGFLISMVNCVWVTSAHVIFFRDYIATNPEALTMTPFWPEHPRRVMLTMGPVVGAFFGVILGLFCLIASKFVKK